MYIPFLSDHLQRRSGRKSPSSSSSSKSSSSKYSSSSSSSLSPPPSWSTSNRRSLKIASLPLRESSTYEVNAGPPIIIIPVGLPFAGRPAGGSGRAQIFGTRTYGSGYPGVLGRGTAGRGFPFIYWPFSWPLDVGSGISTAAYLHNNLEYGDPTNRTRPGGALAYATFTSSSTPQTTFQVLADNATILSLIPNLSVVCGARLPPPNMRKPTSTPYPSSCSATPPPPQPESALQYYRASSIVLTLDGYNNSATYAAEDGTSDSPLPQGMDMPLLNCLNYTIGLMAPLVDGAGSERLCWGGRGAGSRMGLVVLVWLMWVLL